MALLEVEDLHAAYGASQALFGVSLRVEEGQALALMGVKPTWDSANRRVTGFEVLPEGVLGRPRVDVTLRISGFFRDAFPQLVALVDSAARAVQALDEPEETNPAAARVCRCSFITPRGYCTGME